MGKTLDRFSHAGEIKSGKLVMGNERWFNGMVSLYDDCRVNVIVERRKTNRSKRQLGYLWGVVYPEISTHTGHSSEDLHEIFKAKYLQRKMYWRGADLVTLGSTSQLSSNEMAEFITNVILEANELGITVPPPDKEYEFREEKLSTSE